MVKKLTETNYATTTCDGTNPREVRHFLKEAEKKLSTEGAIMKGNEPQDLKTWKAPNEG
jgi:hypothetical protein